MRSFVQFVTWDDELLGIYGAGRTELGYGALDETKLKPQTGSEVVRRVEVGVNVRDNPTA